MSSKGKHWKLSEGTKLKMRRNNARFWKGKKHSDEYKNKMKLATLGHNVSEETKKRISLSKKGKHTSSEFKEGHIGYWKDKSSPMLGRYHNEETKKKIRIAAINYLQEHGGISPTIGKYEKEILDKLQESIGFSIKRNFYILGYFLDGYCQELNLAFEVDEDYHFVSGELSKRDKERQREIEDALNCRFIRIKESDYLKDKVGLEIMINMKGGYR